MLPAAPASAPRAVAPAGPGASWAGASVGRHGSSLNTSVVRADARRGATTTDSSEATPPARQHRNFVVKRRFPRVLSQRGLSSSGGTTRRYTAPEPWRAQSAPKSQRLGRSTNPQAGRRAGGPDRGVGRHEPGGRSSGDCQYPKAGRRPFRWRTMRVRRSREAAGPAPPSRKARQACPACRGCPCPARPGTPSATDRDTDSSRRSCHGHRLPGDGDPIAATPRKAARPSAISPDVCLPVSSFAAKCRFVSKSG